MTDFPWRRLGAVPSTELIDARLQLHHAAQIAAAVGATYLEVRPDDGHPNLGWSEATGALVGHLVEKPAPFAAGLRPAEFELLIVDEAGGAIEVLGLGGKTTKEAFQWLSGALSRRGVDVGAAHLETPGYDIPDHPVADGARFGADAAALGELAGWFGNGHHMLVALLSELGVDEAVRCWPHHFDVGALLTVEKDETGALAKSIGIGLSPGDASYAEPYWYVSPWPYPAESDLAALASGGNWHTEGFTAAVLTASQLAAVEAAEQPQATLAFLREAVAVSGAALR